MQAGGRRVLPDRECKRRRQSHSASARGWQPRRVPAALRVDALDTRTAFAETDAGSRAIAAAEAFAFSNQEVMLGEIDNDAASECSTIKDGASECSRFGVLCCVAAR